MSAANVRKAPNASTKQVAPEPELSAKLHGVRRDLWNAVCALTCAAETLREATDEETAARACNLLSRIQDDLQGTETEFDSLLVRVVHEGIPKWFKNGTQRAPR
jgi:hypothetical protein